MNLLKLHHFNRRFDWSVFEFKYIFYKIDQSNIPLCPVLIAFNSINKMMVTKLLFANIPELIASNNWLNVARQNFPGNARNYKRIAENERIFPSE